MPVQPPFLVAAFFCEKVLLEQDAVTSAIRIIDRVFVQEVAQEPRPTQTLLSQLTLYVSFRGAGYKGPAKLKIVPSSPSGKAPDITLEQSIDFPEQPNAGVNLVVPMALGFRETGVYWFEIYLNNELVTRTPLDVQLALPVSATQPSEKKH